MQGNEERGNTEICVQRNELSFSLKQRLFVITATADPAVLSCLPALTAVDGVGLCQRVLLSSSQIPTIWHKALAFANTKEYAVLKHNIVLVSVQSSNSSCYLFNIFSDSSVWILVCRELQAFPSPIWANLIAHWNDNHNSVTVCLTEKLLNVNQCTVQNRASQI